MPPCLDDAVDEFPAEEALHEDGAAVAWERGDGACLDEAVVGIHQTASWVAPLVVVDGQLVLVHLADQRFED